MDIDTDGNADEAQQPVRIAGSEYEPEDIDYTQDEPTPDVVTENDEVLTDAQREAVGRQHTPEEWSELQNIRTSQPKKFKVQWSQAPKLFSFAVGGYYDNAMTSTVTVDGGLGCSNFSEMG